jgi:hypothetical protein
VLNASLEFVCPRLPAIGFLIRTVILLHPRSSSVAVCGSSSLATTNRRPVPIRNAIIFVEMPRMAGHRKLKANDTSR